MLYLIGLWSTLHGCSLSGRGLTQARRLISWLVAPGSPKTCCVLVSIIYTMPQGQLVRSLEGKLAPRWRHGVFLGCSRDSHEYAVWDVEEHTVKMYRTLQRLSPDRRFIDELVGDVCIPPRDLLHRSAWQSPGGQRERQPRLGHAQPEGGIQTKRSRPEGLTVTQRDLTKFG